MKEEIKRALAVTIPLFLVAVAIIIFKYFITIEGCLYKVCNLDTGGKLYQKHETLDQWGRTNIETVVLVEKCYSTSGHLGETYCDDVETDKIVYEFVPKDSVEFYKDKAINEMKLRYNRHVFPDDK